MLEEFMSLLYPSLHYIAFMLEQPTSSSSKWPDDDWEIPCDLVDWLRDTLKLPFEPAKLG
jgi:hypothetical protein